MWTTRTRSVVIGGGAAVLIAAAGTAGGFAAAHAADTTPTASTTTSASTPGTSATTAAGTTADGKHGKPGKQGRGDLVTRLKGLQHAQWVVAGKDGAFVTHDAIRGTVTAVSPTSLTVKATDGVSQTYTVGASTKVALRPAKGGASAGSTAGPAAGAARGSITDVRSGAEVVVSGTGTTSLAADRILVPQG